MEDLPGKINNLEKLLKYKHFTEINKSYNPKTPWYAVLDGPKNLEQLAEKIELPYWYEVLYRESSNIAHTSRLTRNLRKAEIDVLRNASDLVAIAEMAIHIGIDASKQMLSFYRPGELTSFWQWYKREIEEGSRKLNQSTEDWHSEALL